MREGYRDAFPGHGGFDLTGPGAAGLTNRNQAEPEASSLAAHSVF